MLKEIDRRMDDSGKKAVKVARQYVPVLTGALKASIGYTYNVSTRVLTLHADMPYAAIIEEGSIYQRAQPYLRPALNAIGEMWLGGTAIDYPHAYAKSNKKAHPDILRFNRGTSKMLEWGASRHAHVRYQRGKSYVGSRWGMHRRPARMAAFPLTFESTPVL